MSAEMKAGQVQPLKFLAFASVLVNASKEIEVEKLNRRSINKEPEC